MRIAIVGSGISGLAAARELHGDHDIRVFEADGHVGGHTHTHDIRLDDGSTWAVDTGFIVHNERTYPHFIQLMEDLGVAVQDTSMGFSVSRPLPGGRRLEWCGSGLNGIFAQRRNALSPRFLGMLRDILRFNREAPALLADPDNAQTLGEWLDARGYGEAFRQDYILPMGGAIWSSPLDRQARFPARWFVEFFHNHGLLTVTDQPQWRVLTGGSRSYVAPLIAPFRDRVHVNAPVEAVKRRTEGAHLRVNGEWQAFDAVVLACHTDQALALLEDADADERAVLGGIPYQQNEVVLHTDTSLLPRSRRAWSAWNWLGPAIGADGQPEPADRVALTYNMNILQRLAAPETFCVTLNQTARIDPARVIKRLTYSHPVFTADAAASQQRLPAIQGQRHTWFCGAWARHGFHEDGLVSARAVVEDIRAAVRVRSAA